MRNGTETRVGGCRIEGMGKWECGNDEFPVEEVEKLRALPPESSRLSLSQQVKFMKRIPVYLCVG